MSTFQFKAMDKNGREIQDVIAAVSQADAETKIREAGYLLTKITELDARSDDLSLLNIKQQLRARKVIRHPLGLPAGSVRALLTLLVVAVIMTLTLRGVDLRMAWSETLMIALAHYFTSRRLAALTGDVRNRLIETGQIVDDEHPLYLPRNSIRSVIILAFVVMAGVLLFQGRQIGGQTLSIFGIVGAYLFGHVARGVWDWWSELNGLETAAWIGDLKAIVTVFSISATLGCHLLGIAGQLPFPIEYAENISIGLALFYFGSR